MKQEDLVNMPLSYLVYIIQNKNQYNNLSYEASKEYFNRLTDRHDEYELLEKEKQIIDCRGLDIRNYLFNNDIDMQLLMNTYLHLISDKSFGLTLSEQLLCNKNDLYFTFFYKVCLKELENIDKRIESKETFNSEKDTLMNMKTILQKRIDFQKEQKNRMKIYSDFLLEHILIDNSSDVIAYYNGDIVVESSQRLFELAEKSDIVKLYEKLRYKFYNDSILKNNKYRILYLINKLKKEDKNLLNQKTKILKQVNNGYEVNYKSLSNLINNLK